MRRCSPSSTVWVVNARTSGAGSRRVISSLVTAIRRRADVIRTKDSNISRADRTVAQPCGRAASNTTGASTGCSSPALTTAADTDTSPAIRSPVSRTQFLTRVGPSMVARSTSSVKSASSNAARSTSSTAACRSSCASCSTRGTSAPCTAATEASSSPRAAPAATTIAIAGRAATSRSGVGPSASSCVKTSAVASRPKAVTAPAASCTTPASSVSGGDARQAHRTASATVPGAFAATARSPAFAVAA
jgi:hypothetical protein